MFEINDTFAKEHGWNEECSFEEYVERAERAIDLGWNPDEQKYLNLFEFEVEEAIRLGWDEKEMSYRDFKTLIDQTNELNLEETKENIILTKEIIKELKTFGYDPSKDILFCFASDIAKAILCGWNGIQPLDEFDDIYFGYYYDEENDPADELKNRNYKLSDFIPNTKLPNLKEPVEEEEQIVVKPTLKVKVTRKKSAEPEDFDELDEIAMFDILDD